MGAFGCAILDGDSILTKAAGSMNSCYNAARNYLIECDTNVI